MMLVHAHVLLVWRKSHPCNCPHLRISRSITDISNNYLLLLSIIYFYLHINCHVLASYLDSKQQKQLLQCLLYDNLVFSPKFPYFLWQIPDENSSDVYLELPSTTRWLSFSDNDDIERYKWFLLHSQCVCVLCDNIKASWSHTGLLAFRILRSQENF